MKKIMVCHAIGKGDLEEITTTITTVIMNIEIEILVVIMIINMTTLKGAKRDIEILAATTKMIIETIIVEQNESDSPITIIKYRVKWKNSPVKNDNDLPILILKYKVKWKNSSVII